MSDSPVVAFNQVSRSVRNLEKRRQKRELERKNREFMAMVAHDIQTPLAVVTGSVSALQDGLLGQLTAPVQERIEAMDQAVCQLRSLINDFLDAQIWMHGSFSMSMRPVELAVVLSDSVKLFRQAVPNTSVAISLKLVSACVLADPVRINQVVFNLLSNAVKHAPAGRHVSIECECSQREATVRITNEGAGIPEGAQQTIFERFTRLSNGSAGAGLGLAICKYIIESHGGRVFVECQSGEKEETSFSFTLPLV